IVVAKASANEPVTARMIAPKTVMPGEILELLVTIWIDGAYYVHAPEDQDGPFTGLSVELALPPGISATGEWKFPTAAKGRGGRPIYLDHIVLKRSLRIQPDATPSSYTIAGELSYQACNTELCWPVRKLPLTAVIVVQPSPR